MEPLFHPITKRQLRAIKAEPASFIFIGPAGSGRRLSATHLASRLNCPGGGLDACAICQNIAAGSFPDLVVIEPNQVVGLEHIQSLNQQLAQRPFSPSTTRTVVIDASLGLTPEAQNRLLKTLEEPPSQTMIIILTEAAESLAETVRSRCRQIRFLSPGREELGRYLRKRLGQAQADLVLRLEPATPGQALTLADDNEAMRLRAEELRFAANFLTTSLFDRLVMSAQIKSKQRGLGLLDLLAVKLRQDPSVQAWPALEEAAAQMRANVGPRAVFERLALEL